VPGLVSHQDAPHVTLVLGSTVQQAERHANIAVRGTLAPAHLGRLEELLRCGSAEPWDIDADSQPLPSSAEGAALGGARRRSPHIALTS
jgi:hypothetical protein